MSTRMVRCTRCGRWSPSDTKYCRYCGEAVDPALITELQWLYGALNDLDIRISRGEGSQTITALRDGYRERYLTLHHVTVERHLVTTSPLPAAASPNISAATKPSVAAPESPVTPEVPVAPVEQRPTGPVFTWQAFLSEQAIAIMMYMGGFLGLVAMLSFEIGGWQSLDLTIKLGAIILVYLAFGTLGLVMRRLPRLHTVGGAYLGVFALMTPLLALGIYRFGLQAAGFSGAAMLSLSSAYAAIIYLALAWRTTFITYAYLGWSAMVLAALTIVFWADAPRESFVFVLAAVSLLLLLPGLFRRFPLAALLETPALQLGIVTSLAAGAGTLFIWLALSIRAISDTPFLISSTPPPQFSTTVYALAAGTLVPLAVGWSSLARRLPGSLDEQERAARLNVVDWLIVAAATHAVIALAA
ncbi:MAG TPA: zinc ribbon domain-containing protein, partial [Ktedonobacterales bacterium]|nr:zinc ribbon domain-containing protein [Ktedonobacterales bacterium]